jgi:hypothetical protein
MKFGSGSETEYTEGEVRTLIAPLLGLDPEEDWDYFIAAGRHGDPLKGASNIEAGEVQIVFLNNVASITAMKLMHDRMVESGDHECNCDDGDGI